MLLRDVQYFPRKLTAKRQIPDILSENQQNRHTLSGSIAENFAFLPSALRRNFAFSVIFQLLNS